MKAIVTCLFVFVFSVLQSTNFLVLDDKIVWENVFITDDDIISLIKKNPGLKIESKTENIYKGHAIGLKNTCAETSDFLNYEYLFDFEIEVSKGKYRATVTNLRFKESKNNIYTSENFFLDKKELKSDPKSEADLICIDGFFNRMFTNTIYKNKH